jgi:AcrR family transcriptional regulator
MTRRAECISGVALSARRTFAPCAAPSPTPLRRAPLRVLSRVAPRLRCRSALATATTAASLDTLDEVRAPLRKDLREAIIGAGIELGDSLGIEGVTMRAIAERLSVSVTQLYQHFENKDAIVAEIRFFGLARLDAALGSSHAEDDPLTRLRDMALSYLAFARSNRWLYAIMFDGEIVDWANAPEHDRMVALGPLSTTRAVFVEGMARGQFAADLDPDKAVLMLWAALHGCASLGLRGWLDHGHDGTDGCAQVFARHLVASFRP